MGFTLIEVIAVLAIIGILAVIASTKLTMDNTDLYTVESALKNHIRYAQSKAMMSDTTVWGIRIDKTANEYWLFRTDLNTGSAWGAGRLLPPGGSTGSPGLKDRVKTSLVDVDINTISAGGGSKTKLTLVYNEMGVPFWLEGSAITFLDPLSETSGLTRLTSDITITLKDNRANHRTITIVSETGFVL